MRTRRRFWRRAGLRRGGGHFEFRWLNEPLLSNRYTSPRPAWTGQDLRGKSIRLRIEQGLGDIIQLVRYAPMLKVLGATVQLSKFDDIATHVSGIDCVTDSGKTPQPFDYSVNVMSLPRLFATEMTSIPSAVPYIAAAPEKLAQWKSRMNADAETLKVGIVWAGNPSHPRDRHRSLALSDAGPPRANRGGEVVLIAKGCAQRCYGDAAAWIRMDRSGSGTWRHERHGGGNRRSRPRRVRRYRVAHLAGALGEPVWMLPAQPADWRWLEDRDDSPWYPTMRLFRQRRAGTGRR